MFAHTLSLEWIPRLYLSLLQWWWLTSLLHPEPCYRLISFIPSPSAHSPVITPPPAINSSADPPSLPSHLSSLWPCLLGLQDLMKWKLFPTIILPPLRLYSLLHSPLIPSRKLQQLMECFIKLVKSSSPWQIMTLLGVSTLSKPNVCLHKKCIIWKKWRILQVCRTQINLNFANSSLYAVVIKHYMFSLQSCSVLTFLNAETEQCGN